MSVPAFLVSLVAMAVIDGIWLTLIARNLYRDNLGHLLADSTNWIAAGAFYLIYVAGTTFFATQPGIDDGSPLTAAGRGAVLGIVAYATYDLTNHATLRGWPTIVTVVDMAWGAVLTAAVAGIAAFVVLRFSS
ncbi:MAG: DUF2177 family protein [Candidatus Limnocylindria bacterium]